MGQFEENMGQNMGNMGIMGNMGQVGALISTWDPL